MSAQAARACVLVVVLLAAAASVPAEDPPKIGLALSGGGARGTAHVGVLQVLEELRVPIHCVAGTSMGAVVGGMYAAGMPPDEMEQLLEAIDWRDILDDRPDRREIPYRRKQDDLLYLADLEVGFNRGDLQLPPALVIGQKLDFILRAETLHVVGTRDFDRLPLPFRAVATDLETGEMVVLSEGDLARAMRASMAVPGAFSPVEVAGRVLVDGGLVRNLPVDVVRAMGADVVIAVDVGEPLKTRDELRSMLGMTGQVVSMTVRRNVEPQLEQADLVIDPELEGFRSMQFERAGEMIELGREAARSRSDDLRRLAVDRESFQRYLAAQRRKPAPEVTLASIQVETSSRTDPELVLDRIRVRPGDRLDVGAIAADLRRLYRTGEYELVDFHLSEHHGDTVLHIEAHDKSWGPNVMRFGLNLFADLEGDSEFNVLANYTATRLNSLRGEAKVAVQVGEEPGLFGELYQPLDRHGRFFVAPWVEYERSVARLFDGGQAVGELAVELVQGVVDVGVSLGRYGEVRAGLVRGSAHVARRTGVVQPGVSDLDWGGWRGQVIIDQLDDPNFPRSGILAAATVLAARDSLGSDQDFNRAEASLLAARTRGRTTLMTMLGWGSALGSDLPQWNRFHLGGLFRLSGYPFGAVQGAYMGSAAVLTYLRVGRLPQAVGDGIYVGASLEMANAWTRRSAVDLDDLVAAGSVYCGVDSVFGPLYLAYGRAEDGRDAVYLYAGRTF